jgi:DNA-binding CsgD family transcriptional regulator
VVQALLERDAELAALAAGLDGARTGGGALLVVEGPAGIGKTSLLAAAAQAARARHMTVLHARGAPLEQTFSFGIARQLLEPVRATCGPAEWEQLTAGAAALAARALEAPADDGGRGEDAAHATVHGLFWLVANLGTRRPALVVVDDAHWADAPSLRWLGHLARRLEGLPLLLAVAVRAGEPSSDRRLLDDLLAAAAEPPLRPRPLGRAAAATVVCAHFAGPVDDGFCDACHTATGGNPGVLLELGLALAAHAQPGAAELLREAAEVATEPAARAVAGLRGARALRMAGRFAEARTVCRAALSHIAGMPPEAVARLEAELIALAWITAATVEEARERLHRPMIEPSPLELWRVNAAMEDTLAGRPARDVLALLRPVLTSGALAAEPDSMLLDETMLVLLCNDELDTARALCERIAPTARPRGWLTTLVHASFFGSMVALRSGAARDAEADARFAFDSMIAGRVPPSALMWALFPLVDALVERDAPDAAEAALTAAGLAEPLPDELGAPLVLEARARLCCAQGRCSQARDDLLEAAQRWEALGIRHPGIAAWRADAAAALAAIGDTAESERLAREHLTLAERVGTPGALGAALRALALTAPRAQAIALLERAVAILAPSPMRPQHARALYDLGAALRRAGHCREARDPLRHALDLAERGSLVRLARRAREELTAAGARPRRAALSGPGALTAAEHRVAALAAAGQTNREIAQQLFVTQRTVETHLSHAFQKLDIHSRDRLAAALWPVDRESREIAADAASRSGASAPAPIS